MLKVYYTGRLFTESAMIPIDFDIVTDSLDSAAAKASPLNAGTVTFQLYVPIQEAWEGLEYGIFDETGRYDGMYSEFKE